MNDNAKIIIITMAVSIMVFLFLFPTLLQFEAGRETRNRQVVEKCIESGSLTQVDNNGWFTGGGCIK